MRRWISSGGKGISILLKESCAKSGCAAPDDGILHNKNVNSEIDRTAFANERSQHWQARVNEGGA